MAETPQYYEVDDTTDFGDFVSTEDDQVDLEDIAEPWHKYDTRETSHVFYPICVGEVLDGRYLVEHKIGFGGFSTVWMAHDLQQKRDVALVKILCSGSLGDNEARMQDEVLRNVQDTSHLVIYLATFLLPGAESYHRVMVFPLMGSYLCPAVLEKISMATRMSAAHQLLVALESLHKAEIVHRDLNERNCMWGMAPLHSLNRSAKYEVLGRPLKEPIPFANLKEQGELVWPMKVPEKLRTEEFYLGDFGLAMKLDETTLPHGYPPMQFCSPVRLHGKEPSLACDMWSYMVLFAELYLGYVPFQSWLEGGVMSDIVRCLGPAPEQWKDLYTYPGGLDSWYDQRKTPDKAYSLAKKIAYYRPEADPVEQKHVQSIMSKVFTYRPEERLSATELLRDPSFRAIMDAYGC